MRIGIKPAQVVTHDEITTDAIGGTPARSFPNMVANVFTALPFGDFMNKAQPLGRIFPLYGDQSGPRSTQFQPTMIDQNPRVELGLQNPISSRPPSAPMLGSAAYHTNLPGMGNGAFTGGGGRPTKLGVTTRFSRLDESFGGTEAAAVGSATHLTGYRTHATLRRKILRGEHAVKE